MKRPFACLAALAALVVYLPLAGPARADSVLGPGRETEPIVMTGASFPTWATLGDVALKGNSVEGAQCELNKQGFGDTPLTPDEACSHNTYEDPDFSSQEFLQGAGVPVDRLLGYRWTGTAFKQIPFQVDEMFMHYISNNNSGFAFYSETDPHLTYAFDREGFRWTGSDSSDPCLATPESEVASDPVPGLDTDDELAFMARDLGTQAPDEVPLPRGIEESYEIAVADPTTPGAVGYAYVMLASEGGAQPAFDATNGYVRYERDADANVFLFSESSFENYGATFEGPWYDPATGVCHSDPAEHKQHRPGDQATITTPRYKFRYDGRWLMTELHISADPSGDWTYGPDIVDQWKARAFQQRPSGQTPCCGYEEEVNNWGGSSILMGELAGPVRTIRETWGADSGTNVVRREIFYRDEIRFGAFLRVHPIPPLDGIYAQWDYNAGMVSTYYNPFNPDGVPIDGKDDERFGNSRVHIGPDGVFFDDNSGPPIVVGNPDDETCKDVWDDLCIFNDIDSPDPTFSGVNAGFIWEEIAGPNGTLVLRSAIKQFTPGAVQSLVAVPYYRDDSCFDDGTGSNPGPHLNPRRVDDGEFAFHNGEPRTCWDADADQTPPPEGDPQYFQGSIGTHGVHILLIAESDNAHTTLPLTEINTEQRMVVLAPTLANVGETYGRHTEKPLLTTALLEDRATPDGPAPTTIEITGDTSGQITDEATLAARLTSDGAPLAGKDVVFTLRGEPVGGDITDDAGEASVTITVAPPAGQAEQGASFAGDDAHEGSSATGTFEVLLDDATMALALTKQRGGAVATATLTETDTGAGLVGRVVAFFVDGVEIGTASTGDGGRASFSIRKLKKGQIVRATFDGDDSFGSASTEETYTKQ